MLSAVIDELLDMAEIRLQNLLQYSEDNEESRCEHENQYSVYGILLSACKNNIDLANNAKEKVSINLL